METKTYDTWNSQGIEITVTKIVHNGLTIADDIRDESLARKMAAAPEMAALLERMLVFCEAVESRMGRRMDEGNLVRALLAKIKGAANA